MVERHDGHTSYEWATRAVFDYQSPTKLATSMPGHPIETPLLDWPAAQATGERLMAEQALKLGFSVGQPLGFWYSSDLGAYRYAARGSRDVFEHFEGGRLFTYVMFDGNTGELTKLFRPPGEHSGNTVEIWLYALHMTRVFGLPYQIFVCVLGLAITMLSGTGVYIWWKKRRARKFSAARRGEAAWAAKSVAE